MQYVSLQIRDDQTLGQAVDDRLQLGGPLHDPMFEFLIELFYFLLGLFPILDFLEECLCSCFNLFFELLIERLEFFLHHFQLMVFGDRHFVSRKQKIEDLLPAGGNPVFLSIK